MMAIGYTTAPPHVRGAPITPVRALVRLLASPVKLPVHRAEENSEFEHDCCTFTSSMYTYTRRQLASSPLLIQLELIL